MGEIDIAICLKKKTEIKRISTKIIAGLKSLNVIIHKIIF